MRKISDNKHMLRFRKWSRKAYAMFASIGKCVTIGCVKKGIADAALGKQVNVCISTAAWSFLTDYTEKEEKDTGWEIEKYLFLLDELRLQTIVDDDFVLGQFLYREICRTEVCKYSCPVFY